MKDYTKKSEELQIPDDLYQQLIQTVGNHYIAKFVTEFCPPLTQQQVAEKFGIQQSRISQIVSAYKKKAEKGAK